MSLTRREAAREAFGLLRGLLSEPAAPLPPEMAAREKQARAEWDAWLGGWSAAEPKPPGRWMHIRRLDFRDNEMITDAAGAACTAKADGVDVAVYVTQGALARSPAAEDVFECIARVCDAACGARPAIVVHAMRTRFAATLP